MSMNPPQTIETRDDESSIPPMPEISFLNGAIKMNYSSFWVLLVGLLGLGGGGFSILGGLRFATTDDVEAEINRAKLQYATPIIEEHEKQHKAIDKTIVGINAKIGKIQTNQHWLVADKAAQNVCEVVTKGRRAKCKERLFKQNIDRLSAKPVALLPCANVDCN